MVLQNNCKGNFYEKQSPGVFFLNYEIFLELKHQVQVCITSFNFFYNILEG